MTDAGSCPLCGADSNLPPLFRYKASEAAGFLCQPTRDRDRYQRLEAKIRQLWEGTDCYVRMCGRCGFAWADPFVAGDEELYAILHEDGAYPNWRWEYGATLDALKELQPGPVLDIGAGDGHFLKRLPPPFAPWATEMSALAREALARAGITVAGDLEELSRTHRENFSAICMFQVLEHVDDFKDLLHLCRILLRPDGRLFISVPYGTAMIEKEIATGLPDMAPYHVAKWDPAHLKRALSDADLVLLRVRFQPLRPERAIRVTREALHLDAMAPGSLADRIYRIRNRSTRHALLLPAALLATRRFLLHLPTVARSDSFLATGSHDGSVSSRGAS